MGTRRILVSAATVLAGAGLVACGGSGASSKGAAAPATALAQAKAVVDRAPSLHFTLGVTGAGSGGGMTLTGGQGDLQRPDRLVGSFTVTVAGLQAPVKVATGGGRFYAQLPFQHGYARTDPASFGLANPAQLFSPTGGLSSLLTDTQHPTSSGQTRLAGEVLDEIHGSVPGADLSTLPDKDPSRPVGLKALIDPATHQLRQVTLTGPIETTTSASFAVTLTSYGEHVDLVIPQS